MGWCPARRGICESFEQNIGEERLLNTISLTLPNQGEMMGYHNEIT